jgi:biotin transport system substrate-specific component
MARGEGRLSLDDRLGKERCPVSAMESVRPRPVLADLLPRAAVRDVALVVAAALLTALCAQIRIPLPFSPVPLTGQTFAVLLTAAALGPVRGVVAQALYIALGLVGLPFFAGGESGWTYASGVTGGYLVGFLVAAAVVGYCARRGLDRSPLGTAVAFALGTLVIYAFGVPWLAAVADLSAAEALRSGALVFLPGDAIKAALAAGLLPAAWRLTGG